MASGAPDSPGAHTQYSAHREVENAVQLRFSLRSSWRRRRRAGAAWIGQLASCINHRVASIKCSPIPQPATPLDVTPSHLDASSRASSSTSSSADGLAQWHNGEALREVPILLQLLPSFPFVRRARPRPDYAGASGPLPSLIPLRHIRGELICEWQPLSLPPRRLYDDENENRRRRRRGRRRKHRQPPRAVQPSRQILNY